jgi:hypothetical protein
MMNTTVGTTRLYNTLVRVLDALRAEAPSTDTRYNPPPGNQDTLIQARSRALLHLFLKARFGLIKFAERENLVTDGTHDGGIDAYYIDQHQKAIWVLQSKFRANPGNFKSVNMSAEDLLKMDVGRILKGEKKDEKGAAYNEKITKGFQKAIQKLTDVGSYTTQVALLGNAKIFSTGQLKKLIEGYKTDQFPHDRVYTELLLPVINGTYYNDPNLTIEINLEHLKGDTHLDYDVKVESIRPNIKLLFVPTREIGRIMDKYRNSILKFNPRSFLELTNNPVNQEIEASIRNIQSNEFALFNNGITIISDQTSLSSDTAKQGTAQVVLRNPELVNGAQTAYTLGRIYEDCAKTGDFKVFKGKEVLLRVITFVGVKEKHQDDRTKLIADISKASNSQTKVDDSDRRSNDPIQLKLQAELFQKFGLYYERKRGEFSDGLRYGYLPTNLVINRERLMRVSLACDYRVTQARSSIKKYFKEGEVEKVLDVKNAGKYAYAHSVFELLEQKRRTPPVEKNDRYHVKQFGQALRYGPYAVMAVSTNRGIAANKSESEAVESVLAQWTKFEEWAEKQPTNAAYKSGGAFDHVNYYKGATINNDLQNYTFTM